MSEFDHKDLIGRIDNFNGEINEEFLSELAKLMKKHEVNRVDICWRVF